MSRNLYRGLNSRGVISGNTRKHKHNKMKKSQNLFAGYGSEVIPQFFSTRLFKSNLRARFFLSVLKKLSSYLHFCTNFLNRRVVIFSIGGGGSNLASFSWVRPRLAKPVMVEFSGFVMLVYLSEAYMVWY